MAGFQHLPCRPVPTRPRGTDCLHYHADQFIGRLPLAALADQPGLLGGLYIAASGLALDPRPLSDRAQPAPAQPGPQHLAGSQSPKPPRNVIGLNPQAG